MGKDWDKAGTPQAEADEETEEESPTLSQIHENQVWHLRWLKEAYRVLKPGAIIKVFSATRTFHRLAAAMQDVGFEDIHLEAWTYGSGFPKSFNISKALDKMANADLEKEKEIQAYLKECREKAGLSKADVDQKVFGGTSRYSWVEGRGGERADEVYMPTPDEWLKLKTVLGMDGRYDDYIKKAIPARDKRALADGGKAELVAEKDTSMGYQDDGTRKDGVQRVTRPLSELAKKFEGYGTALKPAWEPFVVGRKPL